MRLETILYDFNRFVFEIPHLSCSIVVDKLEMILRWIHAHKPNVFFFDATSTKLVGLQEKDLRDILRIEIDAFIL